MGPATHSVIDVSAWDVVGTEEAGLTEHDWLREPGKSSERLWLFKPATTKRGHTQGEDWVEKVAHEIGIALGLPCAQVELATKDGSRGSISRDLRQTRWEMQPGAVLMSELVEDYTSRTKTRVGHSLENIRISLEGFLPPPEFSTSVPLDAFDVFCGYVTFDALIANRDRHDENWSVLRPPPGDPGADRISGSYDHASALGFGLTDDYRLRHLQRGGGVRDWAIKGTAVKFEHLGGHTVPTLVELSTQAIRLGSPAGAAHWLTSIDGLSESRVLDILARIPGLSDVTIDFTAQVIAINRRRILDDA